MHILAATRFNNFTANENRRWKENNSYRGCIYNSPVYIKDTIPLLEELYIIEMNNDTNKIIGFGKVYNKVYVDRPYLIHDDRNYNRHTYRGKIRLDINEIINETAENKTNKIYIEKIEDRLFRGYKHMKRGYGISQLPLDITKEFYPFVKSLFTQESFHPEQHLVE
jgi:hypothetical protein